MSFAEKTLVLHMDGDVSPAVVADFANQSMSSLIKGSLITGMRCYADIATNITVVIEDVDGGTATGIDLDVVTPGLWIKDATEISILKTSQVTWTIAAGDKATVLVSYLEPEVGVDCVLGKAVAGIAATDV